MREPIVRPLDPVFRAPDANVRFVDPDRFVCEAGLIDWIQIWEMHQRILIDAAGGDANDFFVSDELRAFLIEQFEEQGHVVRGAHLRWATRPDIGLPSRAFKVWRRPNEPFGRERPFEEDDLSETMIPFSGTKVLKWPSPLGLARIECNVPAPGGFAFGYSGTPVLERWISVRPLRPGFNEFPLAGPDLTGVVLPQGTVVHRVDGIPANLIARDEGWELVEIVGLPVEPAEWAGVGDHDANQGLLDSGLVPPIDAAIDRYLRGRSALGWLPFINDVSITAPPFTLPDAQGLVDEVRADILNHIRQIAELPPDDMADEQLQVEMPPPENSTGATAPTEPSQAMVSPLVLMLLGVSSDPCLSLALGYGTTIAQEDIPGEAPDSTTHPDDYPFAGPDDMHYMVTGEWDQGLSGNGEPIEIAALALQPGFAFAGAAPTGMQTERSNPLRPVEPDGDWRRSIRTSWDQVPETGIYRVASFAAARVPLQPAGNSSLMNEPRESGGFLPIAANVNPEDEDKRRISAMDRVVPIAAPALATQNGHTTMRYAVTTQTIFGLWGGWSTADQVVFEPSPDRVPILSARLDPEPVHAGPCPATLTFEFGWDWSVRRPDQIIIGGRLWAAAQRSDPPPSIVPTLQFPRSLGGGESALEISFAGDTPTAPGATIVGLTSDGEDFATFGAAQGDEIRRYRVTLPGFALDFDIEPHVGLALFARVVERRAPGRLGPWPQRPFLTAASDPRRPQISPVHVEIASLPDAKGECHARLSWPTVPDAAGYFIYEANESDLRAALGLQPAGQEATMTDRRAEVVAAYNGNPVRHPFTRLFSELYDGTSRDISLPKGSRDIHFFAIVAQSRSGLDSLWPSDADAGDRLIPITAPQIAKPEPPVLELQRIADPGDPEGFVVTVSVTPRLGHRARQVRLFRTRLAEAARRIDTMGPPIAILEESGMGWTVTTDSDGQFSDFISEVTGTDMPEGTWRRLWYRAEVWSDADEFRALLPGRSDPSPAQHIVVPPSGPPQLSPIEFEWPGGAPGNVLLRWSSTAPVDQTPLGPHRMSISVRAGVSNPDDPPPALTPPLLETEERLDLLNPAAPPGLNAVWRHGAPDAAGAQEYRAIIYRDSEAQPLSIGVRLHDPLGRISESLLSIPGEPLVPAPDINDLIPLEIGPGITAAVWSSAAPLSLGDGIEPYVLTVTAQLGSGRVRTLVTDLTASTTEPANVSPVLGRARRPVVGGPGIRATPVIRRPSVLHRTVELPDVQVRRRPPRQAPDDDLVIWRTTSFGRSSGYGVATSATVRSITVSLAAPDGRVVEETLEIR
ncbi:MAG: hypothetical protein AAF557_06105 [Pseudomonadota bacterium]